MRRILLLACLILPSGTVSAGVITFDDFVHGQIITSQVPGVTISAVNVGGGPNIAAVFDTNETGTEDPDLQRNAGARTGWSMGNLASSTDLGGVLFIAEDGANDGGVLDSPDDEGSRPAGDLIFDFVNPIRSFGFDLIDVENVIDEGGSVEFFMAGESFLTVSFADFLLAPVSAVFGDASANRIPEFELPELASTVVIHMGGSGAVDNVTFSSTEPATLVVLGGGLLGLAALTRRRRS